MPIWGDRCLVGGDPPHAVLLSRHEVEPLIDDEHLIFLGLYQDRPAFAFSIDRERRPPFTGLGEFQDASTVRGYRDLTLFSTRRYDIASLPVSTNRSRSGSGP